MSSTLYSSALRQFTVETPAKRWPTSFGRIPLLQTYPYLLPPMIASLILMIGAILSLFLAWDGGPREGAIFLAPEKLDEEQGTSPVTATIDLDQEHPREERRGSASILNLKQSVGRKISGYFASRVRNAHAAELPHTPGSPATTTSPVTSPKSRAYSRTSRVNGSAYGYRARLGSAATFTSGVRRGSLASTVRNRREDPNDVEGGVAASAPREDLNFAQRLVMGTR